MKKMVLYILFSFTILTACQNEKADVNPEMNQLKTDNANLTQELNKRKSEIDALSIQVQDLQKQIDDLAQVQVYFPEINAMSKEFVRAHRSGDKAALSQLISEEIVLEEKDQELYAVVDGIEWILYSEKYKAKLDNWIIQGYDYQSDHETVQVFIREFLVDQNGDPMSPPTFLSLSFKKIDGTWKIYNLGFDV